LQLQCKCIYALDKAGQLKRHPEMLKKLHLIFSYYFEDLNLRNRIQIGNIFAKNELVVREAEEGGFAFLGKVEDWLVKEQLGKRHNSQQSFAEKDIEDSAQLKEALKSV
jgi:hypothetical protein